jgi:hypothetical protein
MKISETDFGGVKLIEPDYDEDYFGSHSCALKVILTNEYICQT